MIIFIQNIPQNTTETDIHDFIDPTLKKFGILRLGNIVKIDILGIENKASGNIQYASLVRVDSEKAMQVVIDKLNKKRFKGKIVTIREYKIRSVRNDPRYRYPSDEIRDKRIADRRLAGKFEIHNVEELSKSGKHPKHLQVLIFSEDEDGVKRLDFNGNQAQLVTKHLNGD
jgi:hypothetical protein